MKKAISLVLLFTVSLIVFFMNAFDIIFKWGFEKGLQGGIFGCVNQYTFYELFVTTSVIVFVFALLIFRFKLLPSFLSSIGFAFLNITFLIIDTRRITYSLYIEKAIEEDYGSLPVIISKTVLIGIIGALLIFFSFYKFEQRNK